MHRTWTALQRLRELPWADRRLLAEAVLHLALARLALRLVPFRTLAEGLGQTSGEAPAGELDRASERRALRIGWAVEAAAARLPWSSTCLVRALAALRMAQRRRLPATLYLAVAGKGDDRLDLEAHAWLRCGEHVLTGAAGRDRYTVIASFRQEWRS